MTDRSLYIRFIETRLLEALADSPVVLVHGPRQCGKTTLARIIGDAAGYSYITFDDDVLRAAAKADPVGFVGDLGEWPPMYLPLCSLLLVRCYFLSNFKN